MAAERPFVPDDFEVPRELVAAEFRLEPLGPQHNESDYAAWTSSMAHIAATPGFPWGTWPHPMPPEENLADLQRHAQDFASRTGFTYTVLASEGGRVIGCVYIYPAKSGDGVNVRSWVTADRAELDVPLYDAVSFWLKNTWPFETVSYAPR
jgi:RimJ/RimL family protein N-acetyltransferase